MNKVVKIVNRPGITDVGSIVRMVQLSDGSGQIQTYTRTKGWKDSNTSVMSLINREGVNGEKLTALGFTRQEIAEILADVSD